MQDQLSYCGWLVTKINATALELVNPLDLKAKLTMLWAGIYLTETEGVQKEAKRWLTERFKQPITGLILAPHCQSEQIKIATVIDSMGVSINLELVKLGFAGVFHRYLYNCENPALYIAAERQAKAAKRGMWQQ